LTVIQDFEPSDLPFEHNLSFWWWNHH